MPFEPLITAVIETGLNVLVKDNPDLEKRLLRLKGQVIQVHLQEVNKTLTFVISQQIDVLANYEGQPNCYLSLKLAVLPELKDQANITKLIKQDKLVLEGDIQLAQKFAQLLTDAKPDIEEWLSRLTGDVVSHSLTQAVKNLGGLVQQQVARHQKQLAQVVTEEWRLAPGPLEVAYFCDQVDDLKSDVARLESRLQQLLEQV